MELLLSKEKHINIGKDKGAIPSYLACQDRHETTVKGNINLCFKRGNAPLCIACPNGDDHTVDPLFSKGTDIILYEESDVSLLYLAFRKGHDSKLYFFELFRIGMI